jgi:hypothetical protein
MNNGKYTCKTSSILLIILTSMVLLACGGGGSSSGGGAKHVGGLWEAPFTTSRRTCISGINLSFVEIYFALKQTGSDLTGTYRIDANCPRFYTTSGSIRGNVSGRDVRLTDDTGAVYNLRYSTELRSTGAMTGSVVLAGESLSVIFFRPK